MQQINIPPEQAKKIVEAIKHHVSPCTIFVWGYRTVNSSTHHFDLLVFSNKVANGSGANIANTIKEQSGGSITASVLVHKLTDLATKQSSQ